MDLEDMGDYVETSYPTQVGYSLIKIQQIKVLLFFQAPKGPPKEMVTPLIRKSLEKQGYKIIGSHSGVKLCRWTKVYIYI